MATRPARRRVGRRAARSSTAATSRSWRQAATLRDDAPSSLARSPRALHHRSSAARHDRFNGTARYASPVARTDHHNALARRDHHVPNVERGELVKPEPRVVQQCHDRPVPRTHQLGRPQQRACSSVDSARGAACANGSRLTSAGPRPTNRVKWSTAASARFTDTGFHPRSTFRCPLEAGRRSRAPARLVRPDRWRRARGSGAPPRTANLFLARVRHRDPSSFLVRCLQSCEA